MTRQALVAFALLLVSAVVAAAPSERHREWTRAAVSALPVHHEDRELETKRSQLDEVAEAVAIHSIDAPRPPREWASLMLAIAQAESGLSARIIDHKCKPRECDRGRAKGLGQIWKNALNREDWAVADGNIPLQVKMLDDSLRRAFATCARSGVPWVQATLNGYKGVLCSSEWPGLAPRIATFQRLVAVSVTKEKS